MNQKRKKESIYFKYSILITTSIPFSRSQHYDQPSTSFFSNSTVNATKRKKRRRLNTLTLSIFTCTGKEKIKEYIFLLDKDVFFKFIQTWHLFDHFDFKKKFIHLCEHLFMYLFTWIGSMNAYFLSLSLVFFVIHTSLCPFFKPTFGQLN